MHLSRKGAQWLGGLPPYNITFSTKVCAGVRGDRLETSSGLRKADRTKCRLEALHPLHITCECFPLSFLEPIRAQE